MFGILTLGYSCFSARECSACRLLLLFSYLAAHKIYPVRVRLVNDVSGDLTWVSISHIPIVRKQTEKAADERFRLWRCGILQRVLYVRMRAACAATHGNVGVRVSDRVPRASPRVLMYVCEQPDERAVSCLKAGQCQRPCSQCDVAVDAAFYSKARSANERDVVYMLERMIEAADHWQHDRERQRPEALEAVESLSGFVPALASMAGLSIVPYFLYNTIGFDSLHVRLVVCPCATGHGQARGRADMIVII